MGQAVHALRDLPAEAQQLQDKTVERLAQSSGAGEERGRSALQIFAHILQIVSQLQQNSPIDGELALIRREPRQHQAGVGENGSSALGAADAQQLGVVERVIAATANAELRDALLLGAMDGQQAVVDLRIARARILLFDHLNHRPDGRFARIASG